MKHVYLDENLSEYLAQALNALNRGHFPDLTVFSTKEQFGKGRADEDIIPAIGNEKGYLITKDFNIKKTQLQYQLCRQYELGIFFLTMPKGMDKHWEIVKTLILHWEEIIKKINEERRPFAYRIPLRGKMQRL